MKCDFSQNAVCLPYSETRPVKTSFDVTGSDIANATTTTTV